MSCGQLQKVHNRANYTGAQKRKKKQRELRKEPGKTYHREFQEKKIN